MVELVNNRKVYQSGKGMKKGLHLLVGLNNVSRLELFLY